ncbi:DMT family transporter [Saccharomonospora piscinae]|uniref:DMT family transporter n=1 Tax=Saccharomonospora piscinae TaxID=687388 RepID=UPI001106D903|nr:DMT family transporter [Saccharomonospora piscinae]TLW93120.1 DMT family transporter [Saccharomonospora piscinae]
MSETAGSRLLPLQFAALSLAWGSSFLFMKVGLDGLSPLQIVTARMVLGAFTLVTITAVLRVSLPRSARAWGHIGVVSLLLCVLPFSLFAWAGQHISSGLSSIYNATTPLMTLLVTAAALRTERPHRGQLAGLALGLLGVLIVLAPWQLTEKPTVGSVAGQLACLAATASYGAAFVYLRRHVSPLGLPAAAVATVQVGLGAAALLVTVPFLDAQPVSLTPTVIASMVGLGAFGTGAAYIWNTNLVAGWGATAASGVTYLTPVVGVALGAVVLGEIVTWNQPVGAALVIAGIVLSRR